MSTALPPTGRVVAVVQARMSSSRLPGKVLLPLAGQPSIVFMLQRVQRARRIDATVLATSTDSSDDALASTVKQAGFAVHRGSLHDVLDRYVGAAGAARADTVVRLTGDCPLVDPALIDRVIACLDDPALAYASNNDPPSYPDGLDVEVVRLAALQAACAEAKLASEREHVTPFIRTRRQRFAQRSLSGAVDLSALRWTVDHADDYAVVCALVDALTLRGMNPLQADLFDLLRMLELQPGLRELNRHARNEGYAKSLAEDAPLRTAA